MPYRYKATRVLGKKYDEHRLIMEIYLCRPLKSNEAVHHKNENGRDNRLENLQLMTGSEHSKLHFPNGPNEGHRTNCKFTEEDVIDIRGSIANGNSVSYLARFYGVHRNTIDRIKQRITWRNV